MINLNNETDYKLLNLTNRYYNFFLFISLLLFLMVFIKLSFIFFEKENINSKKEFIKKLNPLPTIFDSKLNILAYSDYNYSIYLSNNDGSFKDYLKRDASNDEIKKTLFQGLPLNKFEKILTRKYPHQKILNNFLGQVNIDHSGMSLIEKQIQFLNDNLNLSIDIEIQQKIFYSLKEDTENLNPDYSMSIIIDLNKEEIISNVFIDNQDKIFDQSLMPLKDLTFEFGSVFKPFTVYSALKNKKIDLDEFFDVDEPVFISNKEVKDFSPSKAPLQVKDVLKQSSNKGAVLIRRKLDCQKEFKADLERLGLLNNTNLGLGLISINPIVNNFRGSYCDNIPFGYGLSISPIQLLNAYGKIITGKEEFQANIIKQDVSKRNRFNDNSNKLNKLLFYANQYNDDLYNNFLVAGKTGTADKIINGEIIQNVAYVSYFPYNDPKYLSLTFMQNPKQTYGPFMTAGNTVKPAFFNILKKIYMNLDLTILTKEATDI
tara:strand:- start:35 stop:1498 length:1464 start_codon:yes stop_codon:yes gene_type:complete